MTSGWEVLTAISTAIIALAAITVASVVVLTTLELKRTQRALAAFASRMETRIEPIADRLRDTTENMKSISATLRHDAGVVSDTIGDAADSVKDAVVLTERRLHELNALLDVVQDEAEGLFVSAASVVRGMRGGAAAFGRRAGTDLASDELDAADEDDADDLDIQEVSDGYHDDPTPGTTAETSTAAAPRIRPRARGRGRS